MKPFEPTASRLERARREGDHPISRDAIAVAAFCAALLGLSLMLPLLQKTLRGSIESFACALGLTTIATSGFGSLAAVVATIAQTRGLTLRPIGFHCAFAKIVSRETLGAAARATIVSGIAVLGMTAVLRPRPQAIAQVVAIAVGAGVLHAAIDVFATFGAWRRRLRMTHDELRRDLREQEGDPQIRARRRRIHRSILRGSVQQIRRASFVVVNPTHVAVALRYMPPETPVPMILVRAAEEGAQRVKALAAQAGIPVIEDATLARSLYAHAELGPIPVELYVAVAQIIAVLTR